MTLTILAQITAVAGSEDLVRAELEKLVPLTRRDVGCVQYDLYVDNQNPSFFVFYEIWESRELWQTHMDAAHLQAYGQATQGAVADFQLNEMSKIV